MSVVPIRSPLVAVASALPGRDPESGELTDSVKCGRCRLSFVQHPSVVPGDSSRWWLCPPCRDWSLRQGRRRAHREVENRGDTKEWTKWPMEKDGSSLR